MGSSRSSIRGSAHVTGVLLAVLLLASCGDSTASTEVGSGPTTSVVPPATTATTDMKDTMPSTSEPNVPDAVIVGDLVQAAIADLVERADAEPGAIDVVSVDEVDWPDGSIGCPQPGMVYTQAIVNGTRIVLRYEGTDYAYHQGGGRPVFYCPPSTTKPTTGPPPTNLDL